MQLENRVTHLEDYEKGLHAEHRKRMLEKFSINGFSGFSEHEKLEIILFFSVPRVNTNDIAHRLLNKYKTIANVMDAPEKELVKFKHITVRTVQLFKMIKHTAALYDFEKNVNVTYMTTIEEFGTHLQLYYGAISEETFSVLLLDSRGVKIKESSIKVDINKTNIKQIGKGTVSAVSASPRELLKVVIESKATEVIICHNHPGGIAEPSKADALATIEIKKLLNSIGVHLKDHIIVTSNDYYSMVSSPLYNYIFKDENGEK